MQVYSHSGEGESGRKGTKLLIDHLRGVREKAFQNKFDILDFTFSKEFINCLLDTSCWLHDIGKYTDYFQDYLLDRRKVDSRKKAHSSFGAQVAYDLLKKKDEVLALLAFYLIRMHHSSLFNFEKVLKPEIYNELVEEDIFASQFRHLLPFDDLVNEFPSANYVTCEYTEPKLLYKQYRLSLQKKLSIEYYFLVNYLFSLLIEADKLDASNSSVYNRCMIGADSVDRRFGKVDGHAMTQRHDMTLSKMNQKELRNFVRGQVERNLENNEILSKRIFTLAAPTGIGKTMTSLSFALKLRQRVSEKENYLPQIIYGLPFINIIEQALSEYEDTIKAGKVMAHYQYADVFGKDRDTDNFLNDDDIKSYSQRQMEWDTWQSDIVITSFVQFFETLIGNRNKLLKKFHHFAGSIIILDEVQTLPIEKLPVIGAALYYLSKFLNARIIIMTATQPKLFELMERELKVTIEERLKPVNLLPQDNEIFACFNRTKIVPLMGEKVDEDSFAEIFLQHWDGQKNCLIVVNKVQRSIDVYNALKEVIEDEGVCFQYLSTNIIPAERERRVNDLKARLPQKKCILVATQVVEAGVDLDFDMGFRDLGPVDSIVQVAGRINRENSRERLGAPLYIVDFDDCIKIYGVATDSRARSILQHETEIEEASYKSLVEQYFSGMAEKDASGFSFSKEIFHAMSNLQYHSKESSKVGKTVSDFQIIEKKQDGVSVFIESPDDPEGIASRIAFSKLLSQELEKEEFDKNFKRIFNQRIITVPTYPEKLIELKEEDRLSENILWVKQDSFDYYYDTETGFIRSKSPEGETFIF